MTLARYDAVADFYEAGWPDTYDDSASRALFDLIGRPEGHRILDVACGHGRITRELARRGASLIGVDISAELIARARAREDEAPLGVQYHQADIASTGEIASTAVLQADTCDAVVCSFGLSDIDDLDGALTTIATVLKQGGVFVMSMLHPCFAGGQEVSGSWPTVGTYHDEGWWFADGALSTLRNRVGANHRTLSTYVNALRRHQLWIDEIREPGPPSEWIEQRPDAMRFPVFLLARCVMGPA